MTNLSSNPDKDSVQEEHMRIGHDRSWALSAVLAYINDAELKRIFRLMDVADLDRFATVIEGIKAQLAASTDQEKSV